MFCNFVSPLPPKIICKFWILFAAFLHFWPPKIQPLVIGYHQMTFGGISSKKITQKVFLRNYFPFVFIFGSLPKCKFWSLTPKWLFGANQFTIVFCSVFNFGLPKIQIWSLETPNDFWGHFSTNKKTGICFSVLLISFLHFWHPPNAKIAHWKTANLVIGDLQIALGWAELDYIFVFGPSKMQI